LQSASKLVRGQGLLNNEKRAKIFLFAIPLWPVVEELRLCATERVRICHRTGDEDELLKKLERIGICHLGGGGPKQGELSREGERRIRLA